MKIKLILIGFVATFVFTDLHAQILHTENFSVILDSTRVFKGNVLPSFKYQNLRQELIRIENTADFSIQFGNNAITIANKFELSRFGGETFESGGYVYLEYRRINKQSKIGFEPYAQMHWSEVRGLDRKYAGGVNFRWAILQNQTSGLFFGIGPFYEYERWDYRGVSEENDELIPADRRPVESFLIRFGSYIGYKQDIGDYLILDLSVYYQDKFESAFSAPRLASSSRLTYKLTKYLGLTLQYQNIYDPEPLVPIDELFHDLTFSISLNI